MVLNMLRIEGFIVLKSSKELAALVELESLDSIFVSESTLDHNLYSIEKIVLHLGSVSLSKEVLLLQA